MVHKHIHRHKNKMKLIKKSNSNFEQYGLKSLHILDNNISNPRYPGFSEFMSSSSLRNSSYCWSLGRAPRSSLKTYKKYNDNIYNIPDFKSTRFTNLGYGPRRDLRPTPGKGDPSPDAYKIYSLFENNIRHKKGPILGQRLLFERKEGKFKPGPGAYNSKDNEKHGTIPILMKFRHSFFYDEDLRQKKRRFRCKNILQNIIMWKEKDLMVFLLDMEIDQECMHLIIILDLQRIKYQVFLIEAIKGNYL